MGFKCYTEGTPKEEPLIQVGVVREIFLEEVVLEDEQGLARQRTGKAFNVKGTASTRAKTHVTLYNTRGCRISL